MEPSPAAPSPTPNASSSRQAEDAARREELAMRLAWLARLRWIALGAVFPAIGIAHQLHLILSPIPLCIVAVGMVLANTYFTFHERQPGSLAQLSTEALQQVAVDIAGLSLLLFFSGGLANPFIFYFTFHVVIAAILFDRRRAYAVAGLTLLAATGLALAGHNPGDAYSLNSGAAGSRLGVWPLLGEEPLSPLARFERVFVLGTTLFFSAYFVTAIMAHLRQQESEVRRLNADLAERVERLALAEQELSAQHGRARAILECMDEGVAVVDLSGKIILANSAAARSTQAQLKETLVRAGVLKEARLVPPPAPVRVQMAVQGRHYEITLSAVRNAAAQSGAEAGDVLGLVVVSRDETARHSLERQVLHAEKLHAAGSLAAGVAHELNTPLGTILGYAQLLLDDAAGGVPSATGTDRALATHDLKVIEEQARRCKKIVQGMLDFARKSGGEREPLALAGLVAKAAELTSASLALRGIRVEYRVAPALEQAHALGIRSDLEQLLVNLVTNAADALEDARGRANQGTDKQDAPGRVWVVLEPGGEGRAALCVEDNGPGVPEALREKIFEPFFTTKGAGRGTGLGLSIARRIAEEHGGSLTYQVRSTQAAGGRFVLRVPLAGG